VHFLLKVVGNPFADGVENDAHDQIAPKAFCGLFFPFLIMVESHCNLVHVGPPSIMIDSPSRLPLGIRCGKVR
jgi:hypothetical protein